MILGCSVSISNINQLFIQPDIYHGNCLQFSINPTNLMSHIEYPNDTTIEYANNSELHMIYHGKYTYNFARPNVDNQVDSLVNELKMVNKISETCPVIIHQGKNVTTQHMSKLQAIGNYVANLTNVVEQTNHIPNKIILENSTGQGTELGYTLNELSCIYDQFDDHIKQRLGFCIDTCHIFASGHIDMRSDYYVKQFLDDFDHQIGIQHLSYIHLNDSAVKFGGRFDRHHDILKGYITNTELGGDIQGMKYLVNSAVKNQIPMVFETPCGLSDTTQFDIVTKWANNI